MIIAIKLILQVFIITLQCEFLGYNLQTLFK